MQALCLDAKKGFEIVSQTAQRMISPPWNEILRVKKFYKGKNIPTSQIEYNDQVIQ